MWEGTVEIENFEPSGTEGFISSDEVVSPSLVEDTALFPAVLPSPPLAEEINPSFPPSLTPCSTFLEGDG